MENLTISPEQAPTVSEIIQKPTFDPAKKYQWKADDKFEVTGMEFSVLLNSLRKILSTPEAQLVILSQQASSAAEEILSRAVERGIAVEAPSPATKK